MHGTAQETYWRSQRFCDMIYPIAYSEKGDMTMTTEVKEYAEALGLLDSSHPEIETEKKTALRLLMSGAPIPQDLLKKIEAANALSERNA